jgi:predicted nucleic acid-binding protein
LNAERFLLDTAYVLALLNLRDQYHHRAQMLLPRVRAAHEVWVTEAILTESGNALARSHRADGAAFIESCYTTTNMHVVSVDTSLFLRALALYRDRADKTWGLTDCISFVVMHEQELIDALTTDIPA